MDDDLHILVSALTGAAERFDRLARRVTDPELQIRNSSWTAAELVAHVAGGLEAYARYLAGDDAPAVDVSDLAGGSLIASNADRIAEEPERSITALLERAAGGLAEVSALVEGRSLDELVPWHGRREPLRCLLATAIAEQLLHGYDLAESLQAPWPISTADAVLVIDNIAPLLPLLVDPVSTRDLAASIRIVAPPASTIALRFERGTLTLGERPRRFDATVRADPVAFLLVAYGRRDQWREIGRLRLLAWGRRPWLALRLTSYLVRP